MFSNRRFASLLLLTLISMLTACGGADAKQAATPKTVDDRFAIKVGDQVVQMQIAALAAETQKGLMFRKSMGADEGMLFIFAMPQPLGFWMRNTEIPLDIGYFDPEGELKEIYPMYPRDERSVQSRSRNLKFALEMNQGWYAANRVKPGVRIDLAAVAAALRERGIKPESFGLN